MIKKLLHFILFPLRIKRRLEINIELKKRLNEAIKKAKIQSVDNNGSTRYVCKNGHEYFIGSANQMSNTQKAFAKLGVKWTWTKHIEYQTK